MTDNRTDAGCALAFLLLMPIVLPVVVFASCVFVVLASIAASAYRIVTGKWPDWFNIDPKEAKQ